MRTSAFQSFPDAQGRWGFTGWQDSHDEIKKGWIDPSIPFFLLDKIPFDPWRKLSLEYISQEWQRPWDLYDQSQSKQWEWWHQ